jgi:hypothetical protein
MSYLLPAWIIIAPAFVLVADWLMTGRRGTSYSGRIPAAQY